MVAPGDTDTSKRVIGNDKSQEPEGLPSFRLVLLVLPERHCDKDKDPGRELKRQ